ncbi:MAG TPA: adenylate/guanylate cyclase domain-containing protein, partial [Stellaceae bacterium]|nr:adenylate/guanylate cyclase domain-containing protein [Stellaceae bacterium]
EVLDPKIAEHHGRVVKTTGDGMLVEFGSVVDAVRCACAVQQAMPERNTGVAAGNCIELRIGINLGDVIVEGDDIYGDGVNIAARIEALADAGGVFVSNTVHDHVRDRLPFVFEDLGEQQVKNITRPVRLYRVRPPQSQQQSPLPNPPPLAGEGRVGAAEPPPLALPDKPSIAVLPFANMSGDPEQEYFADGMVEELITALSRIRWLFVIARNSSLTYQGQVVDVKQVGRELGVRYILEGSVRKAGQRLRIAAVLIDAATGAHLWADRFDGSLDDVFDLQDKVALSIAGVIEPTLQAAEIRYSAERPTTDLTAYDLYLRARSAASTYAREHLAEALELLGQAIEREPRYGAALALAASYRVDLENYDWADDREQEENRRTAIDLAREALSVAAADPGVLGRAAMVLGRFGEDIEAALAMIDRALVLNPSFAYGWYWSGWLRLFAGEADVAIQHFETSLRLNPRGQRGFHLGGIGHAHFINRRFDAALAVLRISLQEVPAFTPSYRALAACYAHMGRLDDARSILKRLVALTPVVQPNVDPFRNPEHGELFRSGLRLAAGEHM